MNIIIILKKELRSYFNSPIAYVVIVLFLLICGYFFGSTLFIMNQTTVQHLTELLPLFLLFFIPAITMRLLSEEYKSGTMEIISTLPIREEEILVGKYLSCVTLVCICVGLALLYPVMLSFVGNLDWGEAIASYIGVIMVGCAYAAIGMFGSAFTKNQIVSFIVTFTICFAFFMMGKVVQFIPSPLSGIINYIGMDSHFSNASRGVIDFKDILYFLSIIVFFLYSTLYVIKTRK